MVKKYDDAVSWSFYVSREVLGKAREKSRRTGISLSSLVNETLERFVESDKADFESQYELLKKQLESQVKDVMRQTESLKEMGVYDSMMTTAEQLGLDIEKLSNLKEVVATMLRTYKGPRDIMHLFINLLEATKKKEEIISRLDSFRGRLYLSDEGVGDAETVPEAHTLQGVGSVPQMRQPRVEENPRPEISA